MNSYLKAEQVNHGLELDFESFNGNNRKEKEDMAGKKKTEDVLMGDRPNYAPENDKVIQKGAQTTWKQPELQVKLIHEDAILPTRGSSEAAGLDLYSVEEATIHPGGFVGIHTGLSIAVPPNHFGAVHPRSGLAFKNQIGIVNAPGTIDSDYRGEVIVLLENRSRELYKVNKGDRVAQLLIIPCVSVVPIKVDELSNTERAENGFGSTGK